MTNSVAITNEESLEIIKKHISEEDSMIMELKNHRVHNLMKNCYRFTVSIVSLDFLISLMEHKRVKNVFFNPSIPPPGSGIDGVSLRYKIYVQYYEKD